MNLARALRAMRLPKLDLPLPVLLSAAVLACAVLWITAPVGDGQREAPVVRQAALRFADQPDGSVRVSDAKTGQPVATIAAGSDAFVRSVVRGLVRERKRDGIGEQPPFELTARADGRLTLLDQGTGRSVELQAFGPTNAAAFARLLTPATAATPATPGARSTP